MKDVKTRIIDYVKETRAELKKVAWPQRPYVVSATFIILIVLIIVAAFITMVDWGFAQMMLFLNRAF